MKSSNKPDFYFLEAFFNVLSRCSLACLFKLSKGLAFVTARTKNQISTQTQQNIDLCFAEKSPSKQKQLYKQSIQHTICSLIEMACIWHQPINKVLSKITSANLDDAYKNDEKAKIIIAPHHGSWELLILWLAQSGNFFTLYKPARHANTDNYMLRKRTRNGAQLVPINTIGLRALLKGLKSGGTTMILPDQKPKKDNAHVQSNFYQHKAPTSLLIKNLRKKVECSIYIAAVLRNLDDATYQVKLIKLDDEKFLAEDQLSADYMNQQIELFIQENEEQYQWSYRRFNKNTYLNS